MVVIQGVSVLVHATQEIQSHTTQKINLNQIIELTKGTVLKTRTPGAYNQSVVQFDGLQSETFFALQIVFQRITVALLLASPLLYIQHS